VLQRANALAQELNARCPQLADAFSRLARDAELRTIHAALLPVQQRPKGEYDVDLLVGLAKLDDAESVEEATTLLSSREKLAVLGHRAGFGRLVQLPLVHGWEQ
jgi:membrane glycosyltransferase